MTISRNRGFSLTEQMVALAISCLAILGTMLLLLAGVAHVVRSRS